MARLVAGVDSSTQSTTVVVVDAADGAVVAQGQAPHIVVGEGGARRSDPEEWLVALAAALAATGVAARIEAIAVAGQQHGLVALDAAGRPLRRARLWNDTTNSAALADLLAAGGGGKDWAEAVGSVPTTSFTIAHWVGLRREAPADLGSVAAICLPHDYLTFRLCGRLATDRGDASGTGWWSPSRGAYVGEILAMPEVGIDRELLPDVLPASATAGEVGTAIAGRLGLTAGIPVAVGTGDNMAAAVGLGLAAGEAAVSLGTSGTAFAVSRRAIEDPTGVIAGFAAAAEGFLPLACTLNATLAVDRVAALFGIDREQVAPPGEIVVLPYFDGERTPSYPRAAASFVGLRHETTPEQLLQATYDGVVESLLWALDRLGAIGGDVGPDAPLVLVGGGARGQAWQTTLRVLSGRELVVPEHCEAVAIGAAALAAAALLGGAAGSRARDWASRRPARRFDPVPRDEGRRERIAQVREAAEALNR